MKSIRTVALLISFSAVAYAPAAWADSWYEHYDRAEKAFKAADWQRAVEELQEALERKGDSGAKVRTYGMNFIEYFPHLKLGIAYYELGDVAAALQAFETEEVLGAIARSDKALVQLRDYRGRARQAMAEAAAAEQQRIRQIVSDSLRQAEELAAQGLLDQAISALGRGLAVAPEDPDAVAALDELRRKVADQQQKRQLEERAASWLRQGRDHLTAERYGEAASAFQQALALRPESEVRTLLKAAQQGLRAELERAQQQQDATERAAAAASRLREAADFEAAGELAAALDRLQAVIALDPAHREALAMQRRILEVQSAGEQETARRQKIAQLLAQAGADIEDRVDASLAAANRVLALDPGNATALDLILRAYRHISRGLLGGGRKNIPPAIQFADFRQELADGSRVQRVDRADFQLGGLVIDESPVSVVFHHPDGREVPVSTELKAVGDYHITQFTLSARLRGPAVFRLTATDEEGLRSSSEYAVDYTPPFYQKPWFYAALASGLAALAAGLLWRRHRRRRRLLKRRFNPYIAGAPVLDENLFIGRDRLIDRILQTVHNNSLLLYGERRIGKTSLQHHLKKRLLQLDDPVYDFYPVYIDLQGTPQEKFFATLAEDTFEELAPLLGGLELSVPDGEYSYRELVRDLRKVLKVLVAKSAEKGKKAKLVLMIDEVDELNDYDPRINQRLRSLFMKSFAENLVSVVSGVAIKKQWEREGSPWYNFFEEIEIKAFRREDAEELIVRPIRGIFKLEEGLVDRIIAMTDCKPYLIQKLCISLVNRLHEQNRRTITLADVEAVGRPEAA